MGVMAAVDDDMELYDRLVAWYERNGFRMLHNGYMKRTPTTT